MANNLTLTSAGFNASGKFGQSLNAGNGSVANPFPQTGTWTLEAWVKTTSTSNMVAVGTNNTGWIGVISGGAQARYGASPNEVQIAGPVISDGAWHHVALVVGPSGGVFYVDGVSRGTNAATFAAATGAYTNPLGVRTFGGIGGFDWVGEVDEVALFSTVRYTANFTAPSAAYTGSETGLVSLYHLNGDGLDSAGVTAGDTTVPTLTGVITSSAITTSGFTISWPAGADNVAVTGYEYSLNSGSSFADAGNVLTKAVTGLTAGTGYSVQVRAYDAAGNKSTPALAATVTTTSAGNNALVSGTGNVLWSPYNWNVGASTAKTINPGAYFKTIFTGTACTLQFDMTGIASPLPQISYRIDGIGAWITAPLAASIVLTLPTLTTDYASKGGHLLEVVVKSMTETQSRWSTQATAVSLTGIVLDTSATLTKPPALPLNAIFYGDSITEGVRTVCGTSATDDTDRNDAAQGWAFRAAQILGAEVGIVGFGASGFTSTGSGGVPVLSTSYNLLYAGVSRSFAVAPDFIVLMEGTNDGGDVTTVATTVLNSLIAATPATTKIIVLRPFNGTAHATQLQAAIAACTTPARCAYIDTAGWFTTANSFDALHPYGNENLTHIAPLAANAIRPLLQITRGTRTARTVTLTLNDRSGSPRANLSGLKWAFFDQTTAGALTVNADSGTGATTNASGVLTLSVLTTLAPGATGWLVLSDSTGNAATASNAFSGPVAVA